MELDGTTGVDVWLSWLDRLDIIAATLIGLAIGTWFVARRRRRIGVGPAPDRKTSYSRVLRRQRLVVVVLALTWLGCLVIRSIGFALILSSFDPWRAELVLRIMDVALIALPVAPLVLQLVALASQTAALPSTSAADRAPWRGAATTGQIAPVFWMLVLAGALWVVTLVLRTIDLVGSCRSDQQCMSPTAPLVSHVAGVSATTLVGALVLFLALLLTLRRTLAAHGTDPDDTAVIRSATSTVVTRSTTDAILLSLGASAVIVGASTTSVLDVSWTMADSFGWSVVLTPVGEPVPTVPGLDLPGYPAARSGTVVVGWIVRALGALLIAWAWARILLHSVRR